MGWDMKGRSRFLFKILNVVECGVTVRARDDRINEIFFDLRAYYINVNKAMYTTASVACGWAGAMMQLILPI